MKDEKLVDELLKMLIDLDDFLNGGQSELKETSTKPFNAHDYLKKAETRTMFFKSDVYMQNKR